MKILFKKGKDKPDTLHCRRADGSQTWTRLHAGFGPQHDLAHYAAETTLGLRHAFFGLLAQGRAIKEFADTEDRSWVGGEALLAENLAMALQYELAGSAAPEAFLETVEQSCAGLGLALPPGLTPDAVEAARQTFRRLLARWAATPPGGVLELDFPDAQPGFSPVR